MFCGDCGIDLGFDSSIKFCGNCGVKIDWTEHEFHSHNEDGGNKHQSESSSNDLSSFDEFLEETGDTVKIQSQAFESFNQTLAKKEKPVFTTRSNFLDFDLSIDVFNDKHFIPSYHIATSNIEDESVKLTPFKQKEYKGDVFSWVAVIVNKPNSIGSKQVSLNILENEFMKQSEHQFEINKKGDNYLLPKVAWKYKTLKENKQLTPFELQIKITVLDLYGKPKEHMLQETCQMVTINFCPARCNDPYLDTTRIFAAYVNEDHPEVEMIRKEAIKKGYVNEFYGGTKYEEVEAIWRVLIDRGIKYSSITDTSHSQEIQNLWGQHIRLAGDVVDSEQANCADGSVFMASILKKIDFDVSLILVPGHMFISIDNIDGYGRIYIETTTVGNGMGLKNALKSDESVHNLIESVINIREARGQKINPIGAKEKYLN